MTSFAVKLLIAAVLASIGILLFVYFLDLSLSIVVGGMVFLILDGCLSWLERKGLSEKNAMRLLLGVSTVAVLIVYVFFSGPLYRQIESLFEQVPGLSGEISVRIEALSMNSPYAQQGVEVVQEKLLEMAAAFVKSGGVIVEALITIPLVAGILFASRKTLKEKVFDLIPNNYFEITVTVLNEIIEKLKGYVVAKSLETLVLMVIYSVGFAVIGMNSVLGHTTDGDSDCNCYFVGR